MTLDWQEIAALSVVLVASAYLLRLALGVIAPGGCKTGCGSCPSASTSENVGGGPLVSIGPPPNPPKRDGSR
jgi:hypothetical protein